MTDKQYNQFQKLKPNDKQEAYFWVTKLEKCGSDIKFVKLTLLVNLNGLIKEVKDCIYLTRNRVYEIAAFFRSVGLKKIGKPYKMNWNDALNKTGKCLIRIAKNGEYQIDQYLDSIEKENENYD